MLNSQKKSQNALIISFGIHCALILFLVISPQFQSTKKNEVIEISYEEISSEKIKDQNSLDNNKAKKLVEFDKDQIDKNENKEAEFLAAKNNTVEKQTIAQLANEFKNVKNSKPQAPSIAKKPSASKGTKKSPQLFDTGFDVYSKVTKIENSTVFSQNTSGRSAQTSTVADTIKSADQSLMTQLNTREYKYYGYYTRIRKQLNQWWEPKVREKVAQLINRGRKLASDDNKNTSLIIVLNNEGTLVGVKVVSVSGIRELDDAAVEAFKKAAPFPNPPKGLVESDGTIKIRWDFIVES